ncbi:hypothetical protein D046_3805B, partial [Vibrio parahaemolyticus V-223/04]
SVQAKSLCGIFCKVGLTVQSCQLHQGIKRYRVSLPIAMLLPCPIRRISRFSVLMLREMNNFSKSWMSVAHHSR